MSSYFNKQYGLYIHIPFCQRKCYYCDFPSFAGREKYMINYIEGLCQEIATLGLADGQLAQYGKVGEPGSPATIYIGGGTPTYLPEELLDKLLQAVYYRFLVNAVGGGEGILTSRPLSIEYTVEANPGTLTEKKLKLMRRYGVNRLSIGVQSFSDSNLRRVGRIHTARQAIEAVGLAQSTGFKNISIDLIYGLPGQTIEELKENVGQAVALGIQHISVYGLQLETGTVLFKQQLQGRLQLPEDNEIEVMYDFITEQLPKAGFQRYEISNYSLPGYESRHNLSYWQDVDYIGLGTGAHSYWQGVRYENTKDIADYIGEYSAGKEHWQVEEYLTKQSHMEEFCFLSLRRAKGIDILRFEKIFGQPIYAVYGTVIKKLQAQKLLAIQGEHIFLTSLGMKFGNHVFSEFIL